MLQAENVLLTFFVQLQKEDALPLHREKKDRTPHTPNSTQEQTTPALSY
jgi:hypothetical protein